MKNRILGTHFLRTLIILAGIICWSQLATAKSSWKWCYSETDNKVYFYNKENPLTGSSCKSAVAFNPATVGLDRGEMIEDSLDAKGFPKGSVTPTLERQNGNGEKVLVTHWNDWGQVNTIVVIKPNMKTKSATHQCVFTNHSDQLKAYLRRKQGSTQKALWVEVRRPKQENIEQYEIVPTECKK